MNATQGSTYSDFADDIGGREVVKLNPLEMQVKPSHCESAGQNDNSFVEADWGDPLVPISDDVIQEALSEASRRIPIANSQDFDLIFDSMKDISDINLVEESSPKSRNETDEIDAFSSPPDSQQQQQQQQLCNNQGNVGNPPSAEVAESPTKKAKSVWRKCLDHSSGLYYYYNRITKVCSWEEPSPEQLAQVYQKS